MNIYYLKRFRKEAYERYGIMYFINSKEESVWNVGLRCQLKPDYSCNASHHFTEEYALRELKGRRMAYILDRIREVRKYRRDNENRKYNKQLAKL